MYTIYPEKRYRKTMDFLKKHVAPQEKILDLGVSNPFSDLMKKEGFKVSNTWGEDLDTELEAVKKSDAQVVTAFEILEHLVSPLGVLQAAPGEKLVASVPLRLWFAKAYQPRTGSWDRHYHEFEPWQFDWLLEKGGWEIKDRIQWTNPVRKFGIRPLLRLFTPRYYLVYAERTK